MHLCSSSCCVDIAKWMLKKEMKCRGFIMPFFYQVLLHWRGTYCVDGCGWKHRCMGSNRARSHDLVGSGPTRYFWIKAGPWHNEKIMSIFTVIAVTANGLGPLWLITGLQRCEPAGYNKDTRILVYLYHLFLCAHDWYHGSLSSNSDHHVQWFTYRVHGIDILWFSFNTATSSMHFTAIS